MSRQPEPEVDTAR
ncbi:integral membrane protein [Mycobacterium tuberculosis variant bovis B2 7505]|nr:integral membrane protein [Mycobacterium tuberculosis variant bovis B2 7505]